MLTNQGLQMSYLKDFQTHIANHNYSAFLKLWEDYIRETETLMAKSSARSSGPLKPLRLESPSAV